MSTTTWAKEHRQYAQECLTALLASMPSDGAVPMNLENILRLQSLASTLRDCHVTRAQLCNCLRDLQTGSRRSLEDFEASLNKPRSLQASKRRWTLLLPLGLEVKSHQWHRERIRIQGVDFWLTTWAHVRQRVGAKQLHHELLVVQEEPYTGNTVHALMNSCLLVNAPGQDWLDAWNAVEHAFDLFRGMLTFWMQHGVTYFDPMMPPRRLPHPPWLIVHSGKHIDSGHWRVQTFRSDKPVTFSEPRWRDFKRDLTIFQRTSSKGSLVSLVADGLRRYGQAMDEEFPHEQLLSFWQVAERLALAHNAGGDTRTVAKRLAWIARDWKSYPTQKIQHVLERIGDIRNEMVHRGTHSRLESEHLTILKIVLEEFMQWLLSIEKHLPTESHLAAFFEMRTRGRNELKATRDSVSYLLRAGSLGR